MEQLASTTNTNAPRKRKTPTEKQIEAMQAMSLEQLYPLSLDSLRALNRRAKAYRDNANDYQGATFTRALRSKIDEIYALKNRFLEASIRAGKATLETFEVVDDYSWFCECGHEWFGHGDECFRCEGAGYNHVRDWFVVDCGDGYRFHQPDMPDDLAELAVEIEPHDPTQPAKEIPLIEAPVAGRPLTIAAQHWCIELAIARLAPA